LENWIFDPAGASFFLPIHKTALSKKCLQITLVATQVVNAVLPSHIAHTKTPHCQPHRQKNAGK
jgi:hypothetical protein